MEAPGSRSDTTNDPGPAVRLLISLAEGVMALSNAVLGNDLSPSYGYNDASAMSDVGLHKDLAAATSYSGGSLHFDLQATRRPSAGPSTSPTMRPSLEPIPSPTFSPTLMPTFSYPPTGFPTPLPSSFPSGEPTPVQLFPGQEEYQSSYTTQSLYVCIYVNIVAFVVLLIVFELNKGTNQIYLKRCIKRFQDAGRVPKKPDMRVLGWLRMLFKIKETDVLNMVGLDAYMLMRYVTMCIKLSLFLSFFGCVVLAPIYATTPNNTDTTWNSYTIFNVTNGSYTNRQRLWAAAIFSYVFAGFFCHLIYNEYSHFTVRRLQYLTKTQEEIIAPPNIDDLSTGQSPIKIDDTGRLYNSDISSKAIVDSKDPDTPQQKYYTIMVENIPEHLRSAENLYKFFDRLFKDDIYSVEVALDLSKLNSLCHKRKSYQHLLEKAIAFYEASGGETRPKVYIHNDKANMFDAYLQIEEREREVQLRRGKRRKSSVDAAMEADQLLNVLENEETSGWLDGVKKYLVPEMFGFEPVDAIHYYTERLTEINDKVTELQQHTFRRSGEDDNGDGDGKVSSSPSRKGVLKPKNDVPKYDTRAGKFFGTIFESFNKFSVENFILGEKHNEGTTLAEVRRRREGRSRKNMKVELGYGGEMRDVDVDDGISDDEEGICDTENLDASALRGDGFHGVHYSQRNRDDEVNGSDAKQPKIFLPNYSRDTFDSRKSYVHIHTTTESGTVKAGVGNSNSNSSNNSKSDINSNIVEPNRSEKRRKSVTFNSIDSDSEEKYLASTAGDRRYQVLQGEGLETPPSSDLTSALVADASNSNDDVDVNSDSNSDRSRSSDNKSNNNNNGDGDYNNGLPEKDWFGSDLTKTRTERRDSEPTTGLDPVMVPYVNPSLPTVPLVSSSTQGPPKGIIKATKAFSTFGNGSKGSSFEYHDGSVTSKSNKFREISRQLGHAAQTINKISSSLMTAAAGNVASNVEQLKNTEGNMFASAFKGIVEMERAFEMLTLGSLSNYSSTAFITMKSRLNQSIATQQMLLSQSVHNPESSALAKDSEHFNTNVDSSEMIITHAPSPNDIVWDNVYIPRKQIELRTFITNIVVVLGSVFWSSLVNWANSVAGSQNLGAVAMLSLLLGLPFVFDYLARYYQGLKTETEIQNSIMGRYYFYLLVNIYVTVSFGGFNGALIYEQIFMILNNPHTIVTILGQSIPTMSLFFCNLVIIKALTAIPLEFIRPWSLSPNLIVKNFLDKKQTTRRDLRQGAFFSWPMLYGWVYPQIEVVVIIMMAYATIAPLISVACLLFFILAHFLYKYHLMYVYINNNQGGGIMFYEVVNNSMISLMFASLCLLGYLSLQNETQLQTYFTGPCLFTMPLPFMIYHFWHVLDKKFKRQSVNLSLLFAKECDEMNQKQIEQFRHKLIHLNQINGSGSDSQPLINYDVPQHFNFSHLLYRQPALSEKPIFPEPYRNNVFVPYKKKSISASSSSSSQQTQALPHGDEYDEFSILSSLEAGSPPSTDSSPNSTTEGDGKKIAISSPTFEQRRQEAMSITTRDRRNSLSISLDQLTDENEVDYDISVSYFREYVQPLAEAGAPVPTPKEEIKPKKSSTALNSSKIRTNKRPSPDLKRRSSPIINSSNETVAPATGTATTIISGDNGTDTDPEKKGNIELGI